MSTWRNKWFCKHGFFSNTENCLKAKERTFLAHLSENPSSKLWLFLFTSLLALPSGPISACVSHQPSTPGGSKLSSPLQPAVLVRRPDFPLIVPIKVVELGHMPIPEPITVAKKGRMDCADWPDLGPMDRKRGNDLDWHLRRNGFPQEIEVLLSEVGMDWWGGQVKTRTTTAVIYW